MTRLRKSEQPVNSDSSGMPLAASTKKKRGQLWPASYCWARNAVKGSERSDQVFQSIWNPCSSSSTSRTRRFRGWSGFRKTGSCKHFKRLLSNSRSSARNADFCSVGSLANFLRASRRMGLRNRNSYFTCFRYSCQPTPTRNLATASRMSSPSALSSHCRASNSALSGSIPTPSL